ncbi:MAG: glycoside hydrolase family 130 protein [Saprospirales bacterium]|nr:glycoside hydrolase family 130 protein [Saprospirales bacterium]
MKNRFDNNPILGPKDIAPSQPDFVVECVLNPGAFRFEGKTWLLLRVAERPVQKEGLVSFPVIGNDGQMKILEFKTNDPELNLSDPRKVKYKGTTYLSTISHLRLVCSNDGIHFHEPDDFPASIHGHGPLETFGIEDCRVSLIDGVYHLTYTQVSESGVGVGLMRTRDWREFSREGMIFPPHNKDCALFEEKIGGKYYCLHRPSGVDFGGNFMWISSSIDMLHWGNHQCVLHTREGWWDSARVGAGGAPIKTKDGWLEIYHGADHQHRYCLGAVLFDLEDPSNVLARTEAPIFEPDAEYEKNGFFGNVVFTNGHLVDGDKITMYYGASDEVICGVTFSVQKILAALH